MQRFTLSTPRRVAMVDVTGKVQAAVDQAGIDAGTCLVYVPHTTAGVAINENADPSVCRDIEATLSKLVPHRGDYAHLEGNSDAHVKSVLVGPSVTIPVESGRLVLGTWQGVFFCEFDGPRTRTVVVQVK